MLHHWKKRDICVKRKMPWKKKGRGGIIIYFVNLLNSNLLSNFPTRNTKSKQEFNKKNACYVSSRLWPNVPSAWSYIQSIMLIMSQFFQQLLIIWNLEYLSFDIWIYTFIILIFKLKISKAFFFHPIYLFFIITTKKNSLSLLKFISSLAIH